tara:strand:+ start:5270 stop:7543 length:2274 start_codon:yes stop_codon:yes gene_type:complete
MSFSRNNLNPLDNPIGGSQSQNRGGINGDNSSDTSLNQSNVTAPPSSTGNTEDYNPAKWQQYHDGILNIAAQRGYFTDYAFQVEALVDDEALGINKESLVNKPPFINYDFEYNFFINGYERATSRSIPETLLPNIYVFGSENQSANLDGTTETPSSLYAQQLTLNGRIENVFTDITSDKTQEKIGESDSGEYFDKYVRAISNPPVISPLPNDLENLSNQYKNIIFPQAGIEMMKEYNSKKHLFPMYAEVKFQTDRFTEMAQILTESGLSGDLIKYIIESDRSSFTVAKTDTIMEDASGATDDNQTTENAYDSWEITDWINDLRGNTQNTQIQRTIGNSEMIFMGGKSTNDVASNDTSNNLYRSLMSTLLYSKLLQLSKNSFRTMNDIFNSSLSPSETVFYEIKKFEGDQVSEENAVQSFYFINSNDIDVLEFVDTQVKYNKQYTYVVYAYQIVMGNRYKYLNNTQQTTGTTAEIEIENNVSFRIFKVPLNTKTNRVLDRPPVFPDIDIVPYRGVKDKVLLNMNSNVGLYELDPISITAEDEVLIAAIRENQKRPSGPLEYKTDDKSTLFQIFRLERPPATYGDFDGNMIGTVDTAFKSDKNYFLPSGAFIDSIVPNVTYYYTLRVVDNHGHVSNPSPIYQFRMVDDSGAVYPLIKVIDLRPPGFFTKRRTKSMRKYIQLIPSLPQTLLNEGELFNGGERISPQINNSFNSLPIGIMDEGVWNQQYKVRLVSKKTGRKIDINLEFKHRGDSEGGDPTT